MNRKPRINERLKYWFDGIMAKGMVAKICLLGVVAALFLVLIGLFTAVFMGGAREHFIWSFWESLLFALGANDLGEATYGSAFVFFMFLATLFGLLFLAVLIGLINDGITQKMTVLSKGRGKVLESNHTLILGYNEATFTILEELIEANQNKKKVQGVVILDEIDPEIMEDEIRSRFPSTKVNRKTKIICRNGCIHDFNALEMCSILTSRSIIINARNDYETTKAILACTSLMNKEPEKTNSYVVAAVFDEKNERMAQIAGNDDQTNDRLELLSFQSTLARIVVHTSRQPGLSLVFTELFNFGGNEFYIVDSDPSFELLYGNTIQKINRQLKNAIAVGVLKIECGVIIASPDDVVFESGDSLILVQEDDSPLVLNAKAADVKNMDIAEAYYREPITCLILGANDLLNSVLMEQSNYLAGGSSLILVNQNPEEKYDLPEKIQEMLQEKEILFETATVDYSKQEEFESILNKYQPHNVVILTDSNIENYEIEDERTLRSILYLRDYRTKKKKYMSITSEIHTVRDQELVTATGTDDFIISRHIAALLTTQISQKRQMKQLFDIILDSEGFEVYMKEAHYYVPLGEELDLYSVIDAVAQRGEILIGLRDWEYGKYKTPVVNPAKWDKEGKLIKYKFDQKDLFVVLAENIEIQD